MPPPCRGRGWRSPLKPSLEGWKPRPGNSRNCHRLDLETFLRGMETDLASIPTSSTQALKPSLEGWKLGQLVAYFGQCGPLETFLRGMETALRKSGNLPR